MHITCVTYTCYFNKKPNQHQIKICPCIGLKNNCVTQIDVDNGL